MQSTHYNKLSLKLSSRSGPAVKTTTAPDNLVSRTSRTRSAVSDDDEGDDDDDANRVGAGAAVHYLIINSRVYTAVKLQA